MHTKHLILALSAAITLASLGTLVFAQTTSNQPLVIPTTPADHNAYLNTLILCVENTNCTDATAQQTITFTNAETTGDLLLVFPERLIAGDGSSNTIATGADYAVIAWGESNQILEGWTNSIIGAWQGNSVQAQNSVIGAGEINQIEQNAENSFIGWGLSNRVDNPNVAIGWGSFNEIGAENAFIPGGQSNQIYAIDSFSAGGNTFVTQAWTFAWSDSITGSSLSPKNPNTFLIRSQSGMSINTGTSPAGVNVHLAGAAQLSNEIAQVANGTCTSAQAGTFEIDTANGCFFYCDGTYRQAYFKNRNKKLNAIARKKQ